MWSLQNDTYHGMSRLVLIRDSFIRYVFLALSQHSFGVHMYVNMYVNLRRKSNRHIDPVNEELSTSAK